MKKLCAALLILAAASFGVLLLSYNPIIINIGIRAYRLLFIIPAILFVGGATAGGQTIIKNIRRSLSARKQRQLAHAEKLENEKARISYTADRFEPEDIRKMLEDLALRRSDLSAQIEQCLVQMDTMDRRQAKLEELIKLNDARLLLASTVSLLDDVEQYICGNMRHIINRGIVSDKSADDVYNRDNYKTDEEVIYEVLAKNKSQLDQTQKLLADLAQYVSEKREMPETTVDAWISVIRSSMKKSD
ncbi:MAG: hypothetical protein LBQ95_01960 [Lachnospiraceae bacterium]|jgi:hypothetical protein|nr:hypothetical protein [Lachnospiraceae bacterium]